jgi:hypothetical protein
MTNAQLLAFFANVIEAFGPCTNTFECNSPADILSQFRENEVKNKPWTLQAEVQLLIDIEDTLAGRELDCQFGDSDEPLNSKRNLLVSARRRLSALQLEDLDPTKLKFGSLWYDGEELAEYKKLGELKLAREAKQNSFFLDLYEQGRDARVTDFGSYGHLFQSHSSETLFSDLTTMLLISIPKDWRQKYWNAKQAVSLQIPFPAGMPLTISFFRANGEIIGTEQIPADKW